MDDAFNPYHAWLGLDDELAQPNFYEILRLAPTESDETRINAAVDKAMARVRSHRPGENAAAWSKLLDELQSARNCLNDAEKRREYDERLRGSAAKAPVPPPDKPFNPAKLVEPKASSSDDGQPSMSFQPTTAPVSYAFPPGMMAHKASPPAPDAAPAPAPMQPYLPQGGPSPATPNSNSPSEATGAYQPNAAFPPSVMGVPSQMMPYGAPQATWQPTAAAPNPMSPYYAAQAPVVPSYGWQPAVPPAGPAVAPPVAQVASPAFDPMAPVQYPQAMATPGFGTNSAPVASAPVAMAIPTAQLAAPAWQSPTAIVATSPQVAVPVGNVGTPVGSAPSNPLSNVEATTNTFRSRPIARKKSPMGLLVGAAVAAVGMGIVGILALTMNSPNQELAERKDPPQPPPVVDPTPQPKPAPPPGIPEHEKTRPKPTPKPVDPPAEMAKPEPTPPITDEPKPEMKPEPSPANPETPEPPKPEPPKPEPPESTGMTPADAAQFARSMKTARTALGDYTFDEAETALTVAEQLAKTPETSGQVMRLKQVASLAKQFREAMVRTLNKLGAGEVIKIGTSTEAAVVESSPDKIILRIRGQNRTYSINSMPIGLAANLGDRSLDTNDPISKVAKGAYVWIGKECGPDELIKVKAWWEEAQLNGADIVGELSKVFSDKYGDEKNDE